MKERERLLAANVVIEYDVRTPALRCREINRHTQTVEISKGNPTSLAAADLNRPRDVSHRTQEHVYTSRMA